jgi:ribulose-phosphate 3-epimerase
MKKEVIPSLIAKNQKELNERFSKIKSQFRICQLDVMDGKFVKNKSLMFNFKLPKGKFKYEAHLMVKNPKVWIIKNWKKADTIIFHIESTNDFKYLIKLIKSKKRKVGIAINPKTNVKKIIPFLNSIDMVLIMTVIPGKYGSKFLPNVLKKVKEIRKLKPKLNIEVDGGINNKTIARAKKAGANRFILGSYLQKSKNVKKAKGKLIEYIK